MLAEQLSWGMTTALKILTGFVKLRDTVVGKDVASNFWNNVGPGDPLVFDTRKLRGGKDLP